MQGAKGGGGGGGADGGYGGNGGGGEGGGGNGSGGDVSADSIRITYGLSDMEIGFGTDLVSGSRPSLVMLMNNAGITAFQNTV